MGEDSVLGFHLVGILAFSLSTQIFFFLATLVLSGFDPLVSVSQLPHTSFSAIAITFLVMNLSNLLRQVFWAFLCLKWKNSTFSRSMIRISYNLKINQQLKLMLVAK
ncbi:hypothetical protein BH695_4138 [Microcystis aeruginosa PCC 7806SL]|uniref:Genome sequencing data, contig C326 n=2 Tax=Microcystis aeruginosa (strain PCC 7806) TaxID=267872 RepID=A8YLR6_MICA7|nr:hypothetical protein BH695_4138 [Microcystis aeruginosa PCC 7806SL]CAO91132.1 unnamed protein product [Microcystis aeruginosa PCC 7806]